MNKTKEIIDFAKENNLILKFGKRPNPAPDMRTYYVSFANGDIKQGSSLAGESGNGNSIEYALMDYARGISGKKLVIDAYGTNRKEYDLPVLTHSVNYHIIKKFRGGKIQCELINNYPDDLMYNECIFRKCIEFDWLGIPYKRAVKKGTKKETVRVEYIKKRRENRLAAKFITVERPPDGIIPKWLWQRYRYDELVATIRRYCKAGLQIDKEWHEEFQGFLEDEYFCKHNFKD